MGSCGGGKSTGTSSGGGRGSAGTGTGGRVAVVWSSTSSSPPRSSSGSGVVSGGGARDSGAVRSTGDVGVYLPSPGKVHSSNSARSEMMYFLVVGL